MSEENMTKDQKPVKPLRSYFVVMSVVVADEPNACRIMFKVGNQYFNFGPDYCEDREHAEWFVDMATTALCKLLEEQGA